MITLLVALCLVECFTLGALINSYHGWWGLFSLAVTVAACSLITSTPLVGIWHWILAHPLHIVLCGVAYVILGTLWSFFKYYSYVREGKRNGRDSKYLQASGNTDKVLTWMAYWPISLGLHVVGDGIYKLFRWTYDQVSGVYDNILRKVYNES